MSTLSQFTGASVVGSMWPGSTGTYGNNITLNGRELLRTGLLKTYAPAYANFANTVKSGAFYSLPSSNASWSMVAYSGFMKMLYTNGNYAMFEANQTDVKRAANLSSAPSTSSTPITQHDVVLNNGWMVVTGLSSGTNGHITISQNDGSWYNQRVVYTNGSTFISAAVGGSLVVVAGNNFDADGWESNKIQTSPDSLNWTSRTPSVTGVSQRRLVWSPVANVFFYITSTGAIYSAPDGYTMTARTAPSGMPASIAETGYMQSALSASSSTATLISLASGKFLRITGLTSYEIVDLSNYGLTGVHPIMYDGTRFFIGGDTGGPSLLSSADNGVTWTQLYSLYNENYISSASYQIRGLAYVNSTPIIMTITSSSYRPFDATGFLSATAPNFVGSLTSLTFNPGGNIAAYWQLT